MVGILVSFWEGPFSGAMLVSGSVPKNIHFFQWLFQLDVIPDSITSPSSLIHGYKKAPSVDVLFPKGDSGLRYWVIFGIFHVRFLGWKLKIFQNGWFPHYFHPFFGNTGGAFLLGNELRYPPKWTFVKSSTQLVFCDLKILGFPG